MIKQQDVPSMYQNWKPHPSLWCIPIQPIHIPYDLRVSIPIPGLLVVMNLFTSGMINLLWALFIWIIIHVYIDYKALIFPTTSQPPKPLTFALPTLFVGLPATTVGVKCSEDLERVSWWHRETVETVGGFVEGGVVQCCQVSNEKTLVG